MSLKQARKIAIVSVKARARERERDKADKADTDGHKSGADAPLLAPCNTSVFTCYHHH